MKFICYVDNFLEPNKSKKFEISPDILKNQVTTIKINVANEDELENAYKAFFKVPDNVDVISFVEGNDPDKPKSNLQWCKDRAMVYIRKEDAKNAINSFLSDMSKHEDTKNHPGLSVIPLFFSFGDITVLKAKEFIQGFIEDSPEDKLATRRKFKGWFEK